MSNEEFELSFKGVHERLTDLASSYRVLNDNHRHLESEVAHLRTEIVRIQTKIETSLGIVKWILSPISLLLLVLKVVEMLGG